MLLYILVCVQLMTHTNNYLLSQKILIDEDFVKWSGTSPTQDGRRQAQGGLVAVETWLEVAALPF